MFDEYPNWIANLLNSCWMSEIGVAAIAADVADVDVVADDAVADAADAADVADVAGEDSVNPVERHKVR